MEKFSKNSIFTKKYKEEEDINSIKIYNEDKHMINVRIEKSVEKNETNSDKKETKLSTISNKLNNIYLKDSTKMIKGGKVSDKEFIKIIKQEKDFPVNFSSRVPLKTLVKYYNKLWNNDFTDYSEESLESESEEINTNLN